VDAVMIHNELGQIAVECWEHIPLSYPGLVLHTYVVMPNHVHGIIEITDNALCARIASHHHETDECSPENLLLSLAIGSFKSAVTRKMNALRQRKTKDFWYLGYMDRIIRNDIEYNKITQYILDNPRRWHEREERLRRKT
jgi:REP element-mobilizing transposase RayT